MNWRVLLVLLLAVLLPLRSALAVTMGVALGHAPVAPASQSTDHGSAAPCPHHGEAAAAAAEAPLTHAAAEWQTDHGEHKDHLLCDACNGQALSAQLPWPPRSHSPPISPAHRSERFDSVVLPTGHRPPIPV